MDKEKLEVNSFIDHNTDFIRWAGQCKGRRVSSERDLVDWVDISGSKSEDQDNQGVERNV